jgi:acyl-CoA synthetase (AMP-forming)/AMP-acid ligase II
MKLPLWPARLRNLTLSNICEHLAEAYGEAPALYDDGSGSPAVVGDGILSYRDLREVTNRLATVLIRHHDLKKGERVLIACENQAHALVSFLSVVKSGGMAVPLPLRLPPSSLSGIVEVSRPALVITDYPRFAGMSLAAVWTSEVTGARDILTLGGPGGSGCRNRSLEEELAGADAFFFPYTMKGGDLLALYFAQRGEVPRGTMITERSLLTASGTLYPLLPRRRPAGGIVDVPLHDIAGLVAVLSLLRAGVWFTGLKGARGSGGGVYVGVPGPLRILAATTGTPGLWISPRVLADPYAELRKAAPEGNPVMVLDGPVFNETCGWALLRMGLARGGRACKTPFMPLPFNRYRTGSGEVKPGDDHGTAELLVKGKTVTFGYWFDLEEIARRFRDGWFATGLCATRHRFPGYDLP